ncbi:hypothetical protein NO2_0957 [Candidatus Termititenax persephonae]|uniref:Rhs family protein n=1 Tax=Candidatus Termititenax persephonae TaxID=2218525 RepID=A0A388THI8_9BACT|nr:hypothetical protein NO2_0957 [Candidatus Termititenax persephonae]
MGIIRGKIGQDNIYNPVGNITQRDITDGDGTYERSVQYAYDKQGNPTQKRYVDIRTGTGREVARENYTWNDRDELTRIEGRVTESYTYDYRGLRHIKDNDGNISKYIYLQNSQPALKHSVTDNTYDVYIYEGTRRVARVRFDSAHRTETEIFINNYQGSPVVVLSDAGDIKYQKYLDPWGNMEMEIGEASSNIEFQYTDKELDEDTGLYYFQARYRDPVDNRFYGRDRVHLEDNPMNYFGMNAYLFVNNNPITNSDPDGLEPSPFEAANMLQYAYGVKDAKLSGGWEAMGDSMNQFQRSLGNGKMEYAMAQPGTNPFSIHDWSENIKQPFGKSTDMPEFLKNAKKFNSDYESSEVTFLGHSKGGAEATAAAYMTGRNAIVFNSAWANVSAYVKDPQAATVKSYAVRGEILGAERKIVPYIFGQKPGKDYVLPSQTSILGMPFMPAPVRAAAGVYNHMMGPTQRAVQKNKK